MGTHEKTKGKKKSRSIKRLCICRKRNEIRKKKKLHNPFGVLKANVLWGENILVTASFAGVEALAASQPSPHTAPHRPRSPPTLPYPPSPPSRPAPPHPAGCGARPASVKQRRVLVLLRRDGPRGGTSPSPTWSLMIP